MRRILLVNATEDLQPLVRELQEAGHDVSTCPSGDAPARLKADDPPDMVLISLVNETNDEPARELLAGEPLPDQTVSIALLPREQVESFDYDLPVDDFIVWPATTTELIARLHRAFWRRTGIDSGNAMRCGDLVMDLSSYRVFVSGRPVDLTFKEYELLRVLAGHPDRVFTRDALLNQVWGYEFYGGARTVDVHIRRLRSKLEDATHTFIETVRNVGYRFKPSP